MKTLLKLAATLMFGIAGINWVSAAETIEYTGYVTECNQILEEPGIYQVIEELECNETQPLDEYPHLSAAITIKESGITLDFNGHSVSCTATGTQIGVLVLGSNNTILNQQTETSTVKKCPVSFWLTHMGENNSVENVACEDSLVCYLITGNQNSIENTICNNAGICYQVLGNFNSLANNNANLNKNGIGFLVGYQDQESFLNSLDPTLPTFSPLGNYLAYNDATLVSTKANGFVATSRLEPYLLGDENNFNLYRFNEVSGGQHGMWVKRGIGHIFLENVLFDTVEEAIEIEGRENCTKDNAFFINAVVANIVDDNFGDGITLENAFFTFVANNLSFRNDGLDLKDTFVNCGTNTWFQNFATPGNYSPNCTAASGKATQKTLDVIENLKS